MTYIRCPHCGATALNVATMCPKCREPLTQNPMEAGPHGLAPCHRCQKLIEPDTEICPFCDYRVRRGRAVRRWVGGSAGAVLVVAAAGYGLYAAGGIAGITGLFRTETAAPAPTLPAPSAAIVLDTSPPAPGPDEAVAPILAAPPLPRPAVAQPPSVVIRYARIWANVRSGRSIDSAVVAVLRPGDRVQISDYVGGWWTVWADSSRMGYVATDLLSERPIPADSLP